MYLLRYTPQAMRDMNSVWDEVYQASKNYDVADKYIKDFIDAITPKQFPAFGIPLRYKGLFAGFYFIVFKEYMVFYRIKNNYIEVIRIIYKKRNYMQILFGDNSADRN